MAPRIDSRELHRRARTDRARAMRALTLKTWHSVSLAWSSLRLRWRNLRVLPLLKEFA